MSQIDNHLMEINQTIPGGGSCGGGILCIDAEFVVLISTRLHVQCVVNSLDNCTCSASVVPYVLPVSFDESDPGVVMFGPRRVVMIQGVVC
jgi:hypothetical protein